MLSETTFATGYTSFWAELLPMAERFLRQQNLQVDRFAKPFLARSAPAKRGAVNELALRLFSAARTRGIEPRALRPAEVSKMAVDAVTFIRRFRQYSRRDVASLGRNERFEARDLAGRIGHFIDNLAPKTIVCAPPFPGLGVLESTEGDILADSTLCEVKSGDRLFRSSDLRQALTYAAMNHFGAGHAISSICLVNPRRGTFFIKPLEWLCRELSGYSSADVFHEIAQEVTRASGST